ncbi:aromatic-ring hydroxylase C-terminal domain-containing protein [Streptomyces bikiniensis]|uniref:aromatic-ring hydroxylase C-terminal domain-containing protein n=1 Tax=Streptomyces bikiniensis TaxID=1896 RepID=UPI003899A5F7
MGGRGRARRRGPPRAHVLGGAPDEEGRTWTDLYGIAPAGAVLVRPDGHVAWRAPDAVPDHDGTLRRVVRAVLSLEEPPGR